MQSSLKRKFHAAAIAEARAPAVPPALLRLASLRSALHATIAAPALPFCAAQMPRTAQRVCHVVPHCATQTQTQTANAAGAAVDAELLYDGIVFDMVSTQCGVHCICLL